MQVAGCPEAEPRTEAEVEEEYRQRARLRVGREARTRVIGLGLEMSRTGRTVDWWIDERVDDRAAE